jgi:hypothetical protein
MKKRSAILACILWSMVSVFSQNVGVNTTTPEAALDVNGDVIFRTANLIMADGLTLAMDVNTLKSKSYRVAGPTSDFVVGGITAGIDGRVISLFNRSGFGMQLNNEDVGAAAINQIMTGTAANLSIPNRGIVSLQYDSEEGKWIVISSSKGPAPGGAGYWDLNGNDIYNNTGGNVGLGTTTPTEKLTIVTGFNTGGWKHIGESAGVDPIILGEGVGGVSAAMGTSSQHAFRLNAGGLGRIHIYPAGDVVVGSNATGAFGKFTVETLNNSYGISHLGEGGNVLATRMGGTSAGIGTFSNTNMRIFSNGVSCIFVASGTANVYVITNIKYRCTLRAGD